MCLPAIRCVPRHCDRGAPDEKAALGRIVNIASAHGLVASYVRLRQSRSPARRSRGEKVDSEEQTGSGRHEESDRSQDGQSEAEQPDHPASLGDSIAASHSDEVFGTHKAHQQLKEELGLDHFEGRSWHGLHRHALMTMIAYAFLQHRRIAKAGRKKRINGPPPQPSPPAVRRPSSLSFFGHQIRDVHTADDRPAKSNGVNKSAKVVLAHRLFRQRREGIVKYDLDGMGRPHFAAQPSDA